MEEECAGIVRGARREMGAYPAILPSPGGGMTMERVAAMNGAYGEDALLLIGGSLMGHSPDLVANSKHFMAIAGRTDLYGCGHSHEDASDTAGASLNPQS
jgi:ribulose-bisphosphate carboxylase large chain